MINLEDNILKLLRKTNTSYKYFFLLACIDSLEANKYEYSFEYLSKVMVAEGFMYGDFASKRFTQNDRLFDILEYLLVKDFNFGIAKNVNEIISLIDENMDEFLKNKLKQLVFYVPYRLIIIDEFSGELSGMKDCLKNKKIAEFSNIFDTIYVINGTKIIWRRKYHDYILKNKDSLKNNIIEMINLKFNRK